MGCCARYWLAQGAIFAGLAVVMGAFGAHGLDKKFTEMYAEETYDQTGFEVPMSWKRLEDFKTGARYQMYHAFGLLAVGFLARQSQRKSLTVAGWCFNLGIIFFSGGLYVYALMDVKIAGMIFAPIGGVFMIAGWLALACAAWPENISTEESGPSLSA